MITNKSVGNFYTCLALKLESHANETEQEQKIFSSFFLHRTVTFLKSEEKKDAVLIDFLLHLLTFRYVDWQVDIMCEVKGQRATANKLCKYILLLLITNKLEYDTCTSVRHPKIKLENPCTQIGFF